MEHILHIVCLLVVTALCVSTGVDAKRTYRILEGENLLVICNVSTDISDLHVYWTKDEKGSSFYQDGRRLEILNINSTASGYYICHALNTSLPEPAHNETDLNKTVEVINVDVQFPTRILSFSITPTTVMENHTFVIACNLQGSPGPIWSIRNRDTGASLLRAHGQGGDVFLNSTETPCYYGGYWECTGYNELNLDVNATRGENVTVLCNLLSFACDIYSPRPLYQVNKYTVMSFVDREAFLVMELVGSPAPNYTWSRDDGSNIPPSVIQHDFDKMTKLQFKSVSLSDFGNYTLKMENQYGAYYAHYQLKPDGPPEAPSNIQIIGVTDRSVTLQYTPGNDMGNRQLFLVMEFFEGTHGTNIIQMSPEFYCNYTDFGINQTCEYTKVNLDINTRYNLTIAAKNDRGITLSKESVEFTTKGRTENSGSGNNDKLIIGVVLGTLGVLAIVAVIVYVLKRKRTSYVSYK